MAALLIAPSQKSVILSIWQNHLINSLGVISLKKKNNRSIIQSLLQFFFSFRPQRTQFSDLKKLHLWERKCLWKYFSLIFKNHYKWGTDVGQTGRGRRKQNGRLYTCHSKLQPYDTSSQALSYSGHILMEKHITWFLCVCVHACSAHKRRYFLTGTFPQELLPSDEYGLLKRVVLFLPNTKRRTF